MTKLTISTTDRLRITGFAIAAIILASNIGAVHAGNADVPGNLLSARDSRLRDRDYMLGNKAEQLRCLNEDEALIKQFDAALLVAASASNRQALASGKADRIRCVNNHHNVIAAIDRAVIETDKDLVWAEAQINRYACQR